MDTIKILCELYFDIEDIDTKDLIVKKIQSIACKSSNGSNGSNIEFNELMRKLHTDHSNGPIPGRLI